MNVSIADEEAKNTVPVIYEHALKYCRARRKATLSKSGKDMKDV